MIDAGTYRGLLGDVDGALESFREASANSDEGEADILAARLILETGGPIEKAASHTIAALSRTPVLVLELEDDPVYRPLLWNEDVHRARDRAQRALGP